MNAALSSATPSSPHPLPSRPLRRRIVATYGLGLSLIAVISVLGVLARPNGVMWLALLLYVLGVILTMFGGVTLSRPAFQGLPQQPGVTLDERQQQRLAGAMAASYRVLSLLLMVALLGFLFVSDDLLARLRATAVGGGLAIAFLLLIPFLPSAILPWTEPDAVPEMDESA